MKGLSELGIGVHCVHQLVRQLQGTRLARWDDASGGVAHRLFEVGRDRGRKRRDPVDVDEADAVGVLRVWTLLLEDTGWVLHQRRVEEVQSIVTAQGADDRNVAPARHVAGVPPLHGLLEACVETKPSQQGEPFRPLQR